MTKAIIFDFDGTLTELTLDFQHLKVEIVKIARRYVTEETIKRFDGLYVIEIVYEIEKILGGKNTEFKFEAFERLKELELEASKGKDVYPYTRDVLRSLKDKGIKTGIITRNCIDVLKSVFPDIEEYVDGIVTRDNTKLVKPHPSHVVEILRILAIPPENAILVGDHPTDIMAGKTLKMDTVGVLTGRTTREAFEKAGATYILNDIRDILGLKAVIGNISRVTGIKSHSKA
jgi:phosphoglycolate phosphatase